MMDEGTRENLKIAELARAVNWALDDYINEWTTRMKSLIITPQGEERRLGDQEELGKRVRAAREKLKQAAEDLDEYKAMIGRSEERHHGPA